MPWPTAPFLEVVDDVSGGSAKTPQSAYLSAGAIPIVDQGKSLVGGYTNDQAMAFRGSAPVIVFGDHTCILKYVDFPFGMGADGVKVLKPSATTNARFVYHYLKTISLPDVGYSRHFKFLKDIRVPLPPIEEQRRIADILDRADALRTKRREALALLDDLTQSIFLDMFGPGSGWNHRPLGDLVKLKSGEFLPASAMAVGGRHPVLGGNGINGMHDRYLFDDPKVVIGRVGAYCGCVHVSPPLSWVTDNALYVSAMDPSLELSYLAAALHNADLNEYASQSGQPLISGSRIYPVSIAVPPIATQEIFSMRLDRVREYRSALEVGLDGLGNLLASLQQRAFSGLL